MTILKALKAIANYLPEPRRGHESLICGDNGKRVFTHYDPEIECLFDFIRKLESSGTEPLFLDNTLVAHRVSPGIPPWAEKLPDKLDIGRRIRVKESHPWKGKTGTIKQDFISNDDCGPWGRRIYYVENDIKNTSAYITNDFSIFPCDVDFLDEKTSCH